EPAADFQALAAGGLDRVPDGGRHTRFDVEPAASVVFVVVTQYGLQHDDNLHLRDAGRPEVELVAVVLLHLLDLGRLGNGADDGVADLVFPPLSRPDTGAHQQLVCIHQGWCFLPRLVQAMRPETCLLILWSVLPGPPVWSAGPPGRRNGHQVHASPGWAGTAG